MRYMKLTAEQSASLSFPIGCPVWYSFGDGNTGNGSSDDNNDNNLGIYADSPLLKQGVVESVSMDLFSKEMVYEIVYYDDDMDGSSDHSGKISENVPEKELAYGFQCPVYVAKTDNSKDHEMNDENCLEGQILLVESVGNSTSANQQLLPFVYTARFDGKSFSWFEDGIAAERVRYRKVDNFIARHGQPRPLAGSGNNQNDNIAGNQGVPVSISGEGGATLVSNSNQQQNQQAQHQAGVGEGNQSKSDPSSQHNNIFNDKGGGNNISNSGKVAEPVASMQQHQPVSGREPSVPSSITCDKTAHATSKTGASIPSADNDVMIQASPNKRIRLNDALPTRNATHRDATVTASEKEAPGSAIKSINTNNSNSHYSSNNNASATFSDSAHQSSNNSTTSDNVKHPNVPPIIINVPLWLQNTRQDQRDLFFFLVGSKNDPKGTKTRQIQQDTQCHVRVSSIDIPHHHHNENQLAPPLTITLTAQQRNTAQKDLYHGRRRIEELLLEYTHEDGCQGRLMYEIAASCWGTHRPKFSSSNAVKQRNPFNNDREEFMAVMDLPSEWTRGRQYFHGDYLLKPNVLGHVRKQTGCTVKICGINEMIRVEFCDPYVLVLGSSFQNVDKAVEILRNYIDKHMFQCSCSLK